MERRASGALYLRSNILAGSKQPDAPLARHKKRGEPENSQPGQYGA